VKSLPEQDNYEILEANRGATASEIERAYRLALATYSEDSLAGYSVFEDGDVSVLRDRIEDAYAVLSDQDARMAYDASLGPEEGCEPAASPHELDEVREIVDVFEELDDTGGEFSGARLRRTRLRRDLEIEQIAATTKINPLYLHFLEEERFDDLPAAVYVRGFVGSFARCVGLDPNRVAKSYMARFLEHRG
jgi:flagellar biosynthesis protein FlhG